MPRTVKPLNALDIKRADVGMHADGHGLYLQVTLATDGKTKNRSWIFRYASNAGERHMGLGPLHDVSLAEAREAAAEARKLRRQGVDPIDARNAAKAAAAAVNAKEAMTFDAARDAYFGTQQAAWRSTTHARQWRTSLEMYVTPIFGKVPVQRVDTGLVIQALEPIWVSKTRTAARVRGRIENVLDWAKARGHRDGENPARWRGHLENLLPAQFDVKRVKHHGALPYAELPVFMEVLRAEQGAVARGLEFTILTAARTGEVIGAKLAEIDRREKTWTLPPERMKGNREHRVPLCDRALQIVVELESARGDGQYLFPGLYGGLNPRTMRASLARLARKGLTVHGFRSTFRDWAAERTNFPNEVVEMALAHVIANKVEAAYRRGDLFEKRRRLMEAWAEYCERGEPAADVVPFRGAR